MKNILFFIQTSWIFSSEFFIYFFTKNYGLFINRFTKRLARINILYVKVFQSLALNNNLIDDKINNELLKFADNAPFTKDDIDFDTLLKLSKEHNIIFDNSLDNPNNSGMISLVYFATYNTDGSKKRLAIKIKRKNIAHKIKDGIDQLLFFLNLCTIIPFIKNYKISEVIQQNIYLIKEQTDFSKEINNVKRMKENCKYINYVTIPIMYDDINNSYPNVIAMEYISGLKFNEIDKNDYIDFAKQIIKFGIVTSLIHGFAHGDLHLGNILFIKEEIKNNQSTLENPISYNYKLGIIDFGIMTEITDPFKSELLKCLISVFQDSSVFFLNKLLNSGIFEPSTIKNILPKKYYDELINMITPLAQELICNPNKLNQKQLYNFILVFFDFLNNNNLSNYGIKISTNLIKLQLSLAMAHGVTLALCQDKTFKIGNDVVNELFHTVLFFDE
jgi:predicted unusual protein kinase regulating ubiquinone biosynthesis (AarF/ABC1/UbiB family)